MLLARARSLQARLLPHGALDVVRQVLLFAAAYYAYRLVRGWIDDPAYATPRARLPHLMQIFATVEEWTQTLTKFEVMDILNKYDIPCGPILSMKELAEEPSLRETGTIVEVDHPDRGPYLTVGNPIKLSDSPTIVKRSPLLGEHTEEVLSQLGYSGEQIASLRAERVI